MKERVPVCGVDCTACAIHRVTRSNDDGARARITREWNQHFGMNLSPEEVECDGCSGFGRRQMGYCMMWGLSYALNSDVGDREEFQQWIQQLSVQYHDHNSRPAEYGL
jgi:hypothetical protein